MNKTKQEQIEECKTMTAAWIIVVVAFIVALCVGCKSVEYVTVPEHHTDTLRVNQLVHDSINVHDSIFVAMKGDTIRIERWHTKYIESIRHDTLYQHVIDSVPAPYPVTEYVEKQLTWWQRTKMYAGVVFLLILGAAALYGIYRLLKRLGVIHI